MTIDPVVGTSKGDVRGEILPDRQTLAFRGIPYATPPVGTLRWKPPQPTYPWTGIRDCRQFGPIPIQQPAAPNSLFPAAAEPQSEDCLYLNVWSGATGADARRPVIVWLYPGAFQAGAGSAPLYHGENWARAGAVLVTLNFRAGKFGFLAHPELSSESPDGVSGNYGVLDQIAVLEWVRDNIAAFGGDPDCVTLFGVSSGASSISLLMGAPTARGLFHRAIAESGGSFGPIGDRTGVGDRWQTLEAATRSAMAWAKAIGAPRLADLRALDAAAIHSKTRVGLSGIAGVFDASRPVIDGKLLLDGTSALFKAGRQAPIPLLVGSAANEDLGLSFAPDLDSYLKQAHDDHGTNFENFFNLYPASNDRAAIVSGMKASSHRLFTWQNWAWANLHARSGNEVYYYRFEQVPPVPANRYLQQEFPRPLGAFHGASIFYSFNGFHLRDDWPWRPSDHELSKMMVSAWVEFARGGRPHAIGLPEWPIFDPNHPKLMALGDAIAMREVPDQKFLDFWDDYYTR